MKKIYMILINCILAVLLVIFFMGCVSKSNDINEVDSSIDKDSELNSSDKQNENLKQINTKNYAINVDTTLKGIELIKAAKIKNPINTISYDMKTIIESKDLSYEIIGTMLKSDNNYRTKTQSNSYGAEGISEDKMITIYNDNEKMIYKYNESTKQGYKYKDDKMAGNGPVMEGEYDLTMLYAEESNLINAEVITYNGEPVIYFEILEGENLVASWVSLKYGITVRTETYDGDTLAATTVISNIKIPTEINPADFLSPEDVVFEYYSESYEENGL